MIFNRTTKFLLGASILGLLNTVQNVQGQVSQGRYDWDNLPEVLQPEFRMDTLDIREYGARGDGHTLKTRIINEALVACSEKDGGVVLIPAGYWVSGPIELQSHVNLHLDDNAFLQFTSDFDQYEIVEGNYEGKDR